MSKRRRRWARWAKGLLIGFGALLLAIVGLLLAIVWIPAASQRLIVELVTRWDATNPAQIRWRSIEGSLGAGLRIHELELHDGDARPLLSVEQLSLSLGFRSLLGGVVEVERLELHGVDVWADHRWADLGDPDAPPRPETPGYGPDLPIEIRATVVIHDARVWLDESVMVELRALQLRASGLGREAEAELRLEGVELTGQQLRIDELALAARWEDPVVYVDHLELVGPLLELERLRGRYDLAAEIGELRLDADARLDALAHRFELDLSRLGTRAEIGLSARGGPGAIELVLDLDLGAAAELRIDAAGVPTGPTGRRWASARVRGRIDPGVLIEHPSLGPLRFELLAAIRGRDSLPGLVASLVGEVEDFRSGERLSIGVEAAASSIDPPAGNATVELRGAGLALDASLTRDPAALRGRWSLEIPALGRPLSLVATLIDQPELAQLRGRLAASGRCEAGEAIESLVCPLELRLRRAHGFGVALDDLRLQARVEPLADPLALDVSLVAAGLRPPGEALALEHLRARAQGTLEHLAVEIDGVGNHEQVRVAGAVSLGDRIVVALDQLALRSDRGDVVTRVELRRPTRLIVGDGTLEIEELSLAAAGGQIDVDGRLGLAAGNPSELRLGIAKVELARLDPLVPGPSFAGRLSLDAALTGTWPRPRVDLHVRARRLRIADLHPGDVDLLASLGRSEDPQLHRRLAAELGEDSPALDTEGLQVWARARGPMAADFVLAAALPLDLADGVRLPARRELAARVTTKRFELLELGGLMPEAPSWWLQREPDAAAPLGSPRLIPEGVVDLDLQIAGTPERPRASVVAVARRLVVDRTRLGSLLARARVDETGVGLELSVRPGFGQVDLRAAVPARLDLVEPQLEWAEHDEHLVSLDVRGLDLRRLRATLGPPIPALEQALEQAELDGTISVQLRASGTLEQPELHAAVRTHDLRHRDQRLGSLRVFTAYVPGELELELFANGPFARRLDARILAPLWLPLGGEALRIDPSRRWLAQLEVDTLSLASLGRYLGPLPVTGELGAALSLTGTLADPRVELSARLDDLRSSSQAALGDLLVEAEFADGTARVDADIIRSGARILVAGVELPLLVDLRPELVGSTIRWDSAGHHRVFAVGRRIDEELLGALFGRELDGSTTGVVERRRSSELTLDLAGGGRLDAFRIEGALGGRLAVDDQLALALDVDLTLDESAQRLALVLTPVREAAVVEQPLSRRAERRAQRRRSDAPEAQRPAEGSEEGFVGEVELGALVPALVAGEQTWADIPLFASISAPNFELDGLAPLLPRAIVDPDGRLYANLRGGGTLGAPQLRGAIELEDAAITVIPMRQRLRDINVELALDQRVVELRRASIGAGRGGVEGRGRAELAQTGDLDASAELVIEAFPLIRPGLPAMTIDTRVALDLQRRAEATRMEVVLRGSEVTVAGTTEATPNPIPSSPDVVLVTRAGPSPIALAHLHEQTPEPPSEQLPEAERFELRVELRDPLQISGASIDMAWAGAVDLQIQGSEVEVGGEVEARRGRLRLFGNSFDLRRGIVTLPADGTVDPFIDVEAVSELPEAEVTVSVRGRISRPTLEFSSSPALSEYQILTLLITGSTELGEGEGDVAAQAASLLAAVSNPQLQSQLNQRLGIDRVALGFGDSIDQPILAVGKRFGRDVYVETRYHHNAPEDQNTTQLAIDYAIRRRWTLEGFFGDAAIGAIGIYWTRTFPQAPWSSDLELPSLLVGH